MRILYEILIAIAATFVLQAIVTTLYSMARRRSLTQRIISIGSRLGLESDLETKNLELSLANLEAAVDKVSVVVADSSADSVRLRKAFDALPIGIMILDEHLEEVFRNTTLIELLQDLTVDAFISKLVSDIKNDNFEGARTFETFGPPRKVFEAKLYRIINAQRVVGSMIYLEEVTEKKHLEEVRRDFVANVSHELKTPMAALGVLAETISQESDMEVIKPLIARIQTEAFRAGKIIDDLLDLSRIEAGGTFAFEPVELSLVMAEAVERVKYLAEKHKVKLVFKEPENVIILGSRRDLVSAFYNLLENAIKYSESEGVVEFYATAGDKEVSVMVSDQGIGIPQKDLNRIFERFYRVDPGRSRASGGTGLGLAIVKHVVQNHSGTISVVSREGEGSTFTVILPVVKNTMDKGAIDNDESVS